MMHWDLGVHSKCCQVILGGWTEMIWWLRAASPLLLAEEAELGWNSISIPWFHKIPHFDSQGCCVQVPGQGCAYCCTEVVVTQDPLLHVGSFTEFTKFPLLLQGKWPFVQEVLLWPLDQGTWYFVCSVLLSMLQTPGLSCGKFPGGCCYKLDGLTRVKFCLLVKKPWERSGMQCGIFDLWIGPSWCKIPIFYRFVVFLPLEEHEAD